MRKIILGVLFTFFCIASGAQVNEQALAALVKGSQGEVGIAVIFRDKVYTVSNAGKYPLPGVSRIHVAVAALNKMENEKITLERKVTVKPGQIHKDMPSPLREKYPKGKIKTTYRELLEYAVSYNDCNATDWLTAFVGGPREVNNYIKSLGIANFNLSKTEAETHKELSAAYSNWGTPLSVVQLLKKLYTGNILFEEHTEFLQDLMLDCRTGEDRMKAGLLGETTIAHVSGSTDRTPKGVKPGDCDAGVIHLPNGEKCYIAVTIKDSRESEAADAKLMAKVANTVFRQIFVWR